MLSDSILAKMSAGKSLTKEQQRKKIQKDIDDFLKNGGKITVYKPGESGIKKSKSNIKEKQDE